MRYNKVMRAKADKSPWNVPQTIVEILNAKKADPDEAELRNELKLWVSTWLDSGRNLLLMAQQMEKSKADKIYGDMSCYFEICASGEPRLIVLPYRIESEEVQEARGPDPKGSALTFFRQLLIDRESWKVAGPCSNCGNYFLRKTRHTKHKYCTRAHGSDISARKSTKERLQKEHEVILQLARNALSAYSKLPHEARAVQTWRKFVLEELSKAGHKRKVSSLTRWVNDEEREAGSGLSVPEDLKTKGDR
jgi:hypothetical protein